MNMITINNSEEAAMTDAFRVDVIASYRITLHYTAHEPGSETGPISSTTFSPRLARPDKLLRLLLA